MKQFNNLEKLIGYLMLVGAILFNLWLYRLEPSALVDPNDNHFQYALVDRTNQIWDFAYKTCSKDLFLPFCHFSYLVDHWVPNWAEGYNLPYYYSHLPQIAIVASWRALSPILPMSLFSYYHVVIYLLLSLFPISLFIALRVLGLPWLTAGFGALLATHISTDGLYGLDPSSFLWRGYGLSSQLFAMVWLPLAIAHSWRFLSEKKSLWLAVFFLVATTAGHLGIGIIALMSVGLLALGRPVELVLRERPLGEIFGSLRENVFGLAILGGATVAVLGYWIIPILLHNNYHNISVWDPIWKFNSYGAKETIVRFLNGDLFDFGRFPVFTLLTLVGFFALLINSPANLLSFSLLFAVWFLLYFGRTTWGGLIDLIPGMAEFHLSRFIVGIHTAGLFLVPVGISWILEQFSNVAMQQSNQIVKLLNGYIVKIALIAGVALLVYPQTIRYAAYNDTLILRGNTNAQRVKADADTLFAALRSYEAINPGRVYAGRGGNWGKKFRVAETPYYMHLSTYGITTVLWLPETWSPNSDTEQYFSDNRPADYNLYNIRYVVSPPDVAAQPFWKFLKQSPTWKLYEVATSNYVAGGIRPAIVAIDKESFTSVVRLWITSDFPRQGLYPELTFAKDYPKNVGLPNFKMIDEATYQVPDGTIHNLFSEPPLYSAPRDKGQETGKTVTVLSQSSDADMIFRAKVEVPKNCTECIVILKQTFHPNWKVTIDSQRAPAFTVFPFFIGVTVPEGTHEVVFSYQPSSLKLILLFGSFVLIGGFVYVFIRRRYNTHRNI